MNRVKIKRDELLLALDSSGETESFLDRTTGEILVRWEDGPEVDQIDTRLAAGPEDRYVTIDPFPSRERFEVMVDFAESLPDSAMKGRLLRALEARKPFRGFKDALVCDTVVRERWFAFENAAMTGMAERWLASLGIDFKWVEGAAE